MAYAYNLTTTEAKLGPLRDLGYPELSSGFQASIGNTEIFPQDHKPKPQNLWLLKFKI